MPRYIDAEELLAWYDDIRKREREILSGNYHKERKDEARIKISTLDKVYFKVQELKDKTAEDMVVAALEKQIPKKIIIVDGYDFCPTCSFNLGSDAIRRGLPCWSSPFCHYCGQHLDWKAEGENR